MPTMREPRGTEVALLPMLWLAMVGRHEPLVPCVPENAWALGNAERFVWAARGDSGYMDADRAILATGDWVASQRWNSGR